MGGCFHPMGTFRWGRFHLGTHFFGHRDGSNHLGTDFSLKKLSDRWSCECTCHCPLCCAPTMNHIAHHLCTLRQSIGALSHCACFVWIKALGLCLPLPSACAPVMNHFAHCLCTWRQPIEALRHCGCGSVCQSKHCMCACL